MAVMGSYSSLKPGLRRVLLNPPSYGGLACPCGQKLEKLSLERGYGASQRVLSYPG